MFTFQGFKSLNVLNLQVLSERTDIELWVCANIIRLFNDDNTIPFIIRYRRELINNLDADVKLNILVTVVDGSKAKIYLKNFGEFFINQVDAADTAS